MVKRFRVYKYLSAFIQHVSMITCIDIFMINGEQILGFFLIFVSSHCILVRFPLCTLVRFSLEDNKSHR